MLLSVLLFWFLYDHVACNFTKELLAEYTVYANGWNLAWASPAQKACYKRNRTLYDPQNILISRFQMHECQIFFSMPRFKKGVPFTLSTGSIKYFDKHQLLLSPFPSWSYHISDQTCPRKIQNAVDLVIDADATMWVLDVGVIHTQEKPIRMENPKIWAFSVINATFMNLIDLRLLTQCKSRLQFIQYEKVSDCGGMTVLYVSDAGLTSILVWTVEKNSGLRVQFPPETAGESPCKDIFYIAIVQSDCKGALLFFTYLNAPKLYYIPTQNIRAGRTEGAVIDVGVKPARMVILGTDGGTSLFFRVRGESDIYMWDSREAFRHDNFVHVYKSDDCRYTTQVTPGYRNLMWMIQSNFQDFVRGCTGCLGVSSKVSPLVKFCEEVECLRMQPKTLPLCMPGNNIGGLTIDDDSQAAAP